MLVVIFCFPAGMNHGKSTIFRSLQLMFPPDDAMTLFFHVLLVTFCFPAGMNYSEGTITRKEVIAADVPSTYIT
jgi:hypothetical protein